MPRGQALAIHQQVGDRVSQAATLNNIGRVHQDRGELDTAVDYFQQDLAIRQQVSGRYEEGAIFFHLAVLAIKPGRKVEGVRLAAVRYLIHQEIGHANEEQDIRNLTNITDQLGYSQEQLEELLTEVKEAYRTDRGAGLVRAAFERTSAEDCTVWDRPA